MQTFENRIKRLHKKANFQKKQDDGETTYY